MPGEKRPIFAGELFRRNLRQPHVPITSEVLVCIQNMGDADQDLTGWHLRDQAHDDFEFPPFVLHAGEVGLGTYFGR